MIHPTSIVHQSTVIEDNVYIGPGCVIGYPAEHLSYWGKEPEFKVVIKSGTVITGMCTIDRGTVNDTIIGEDCFIMKQVHIGHDAVIGSRVRLSPHCTIGGHCVLGNDVNFGMNSVIHQRAQVPYGCMIGMGAVITKSTEMWPNAVFVGNPAYYLRSNER
jgi:UDP-N-acetylglucosamine acyltransferase